MTDKCTPSAKVERLAMALYAEDWLAQRPRTWGSIARAWNEEASHDEQLQRMYRRSARYVLRMLKGRR